MMPINEARRIVAFIDRYHMSFKRLAHELDCSEVDARMAYCVASDTCNVADARSTIAKLNELANTFAMTTSELMVAFG